MAEFFDKAQPGWGKPKFKSKKAPRQGFKMDQAKIKDGCLFLEKPRAVKETWNGFKLSSAPLSDDFGTISFYKEKTDTMHPFLLKYLIQKTSLRQADIQAWISMLDISITETVNA